MESSADFYGLYNVKVTFINGGFKTYNKVYIDREEYKLGRLVLTSKSGIVELSSEKGEWKSIDYRSSPVGE
jgi:hypothetical protein